MDNLFSMFCPAFRYTLFLFDLPSAGLQANQKRKRIFTAIGAKIQEVNFFRHFKRIPESHWQKPKVCQTFSS
jgi:hypothetical protein